MKRQPNLIVQALIINILQEKIMMQNFNYALFFLLVFYVKKKPYNLSHEKGKYVPFHKGKQMTNMKMNPPRNPSHVFITKRLITLLSIVMPVLLQKHWLNVNPI